MGRLPRAPEPCAMVRAVTRFARGSSRLPALVLAAVTMAGCTLAQRPSVKVVDPELLAKGTVLERDPHRRKGGGFTFGPYVVRDAATRSEAPDPDGPLASEDVRRPVTQDRAGLTLEAPETRRTWTTTCTLQRRAPPTSEYRAALDENGDEVAVDCTAKAPGLPPWAFHARALLSSNFVGELGPAGGPAWKVEILTRAIYAKRIERILPVPVAQLRHDRKAVVSVLLGRPEQAWLAKDLEPLTAEAALALLLTLRLLPWELAE
jgi:hypothetical protein